MAIANLNSLLVAGEDISEESDSFTEVDAGDASSADWSDPFDEFWSLPGSSFKYGDPSLTEPRHFLGRPLQTIPDVVLLAYTNFAEHGIAGLSEAIEAESFAGLYLIREGRVGVLKNYNPGAPMAAIQLERLIALGVRSFVIVGIAGGLRPDGKIGDVHIAERALRDEGTSRHYLRPTKYAWPDISLRREVEVALAGSGVDATVSATWTTDALFRETEREVQAYSSLGIDTVEMEASAVFSIAKFRGVRAAAVFVISDLVLAAGWKRAETPLILNERVAELVRSLAGHNWSQEDRRG
jgi:uridine phosphorylase